MDGFALLVGHLLGDYVFQTDWMARQKGAPGGSLACAVHCTVYTVCVWACSFWWMPWWGLLLCWLAHFPADRWRLARRWMAVAGQEGFATGPLAPWSVVVTDNTYHLLTLLLIGAARAIN